MDPQAPIVAKVADFGLSQRAAPEISGALCAWQWLAPEVIDPSKNVYDVLSDVYSFGMVMWELADGNAPFDELYNNPRFCNLATSQLNELAIKASIVQETLRPTMPEGVNPEYARLIRQCWNVVPTNRPDFGYLVSKLAALCNMPDAAEELTNVPFKIQRLSSDTERDTPTASPTVAVSQLQDVISPPDVSPTTSAALPAQAYTMRAVGEHVWVGLASGDLVVLHPPARGAESLASPRTSPRSSPNAATANNTTAAGTATPTSPRHGNATPSSSSSSSSPVLPVSPRISGSSMIVQQLSAHTDRIYCILAVPQQGAIWTGACDGMIQIWDTKVRQCHITFGTRSTHKFSILTYSRVCMLCVSPQTFGLRKEWLAHDSSKSMVNCLERVGDTVWSGSPEERAVRVWDLRTCTLLSRILLDGPVTGMSFLGESVFVSLVCEVMVCDASLGEIRGSWHAHKSKITHLFTDTRNDCIWTFSDSEVRLWRLATNGIDQVARMSANQQRVSGSIAVGDYLWVGALDGTIVIWQLSVCCRY